jgi:ribosomal-protein-alanine N-acetyltransferase
MLAIRRGLQEDLPAVAAIQAASPEAAHWQVTDYLQYGLRVAASEGTVVGFLVFRRLGAGEGELLNLAVAPQSRRRGVAKSLVQAFLAECPEGVWLEVRESNTAARNLYKSMGFQEVSVRSNYYQAPPEPAIVMKFHSC